MSQPPVAAGAIELSWVLPLYRTAKQLPELLRRVRSTAERIGVDYEVILVDDACPEHSGAIAQPLAADDPHVRVLHLPRNRGQDDALREGLRASRGAWAVMLDADLQDPPEAVARLWAERDHATDAVFARRVGHYTTPIRRLNSILYRRAMRIAGGLPRGACLFVLLRDSLVAHINASSEKRNVALLALIAGARVRCKSVDVIRSVRLEGDSAYTSISRLRKAARSLWQTFAARHLARIP